MKTITNSQLEKVKKIEKEYGVDLQIDEETSEIEAYDIINAYHSQQGTKLPLVAEEEESISSVLRKPTSDKDVLTERLTVDKNPADIQIQKVNLSKEEQELYDY